MDGYFDGLFACLDGMVIRGFLRAEDRARLVTADNMESLLTSMDEWRAPGTLKFTLAKRVI